MHAGDDLTADEALAEIGRMRRTIGRSARWGGWMFLAWAVAAFFYWTAMFFASEGVVLVAAGGWLVMTAVSLVYTYRKRVYAACHAGTNRWVAVAWLVTFVGASFYGDAMPERPGGWWVPGGLAVAVLSALPVLYAGWRMRPWEGER